MYWQFFSLENFCCPRRGWRRHSFSSSIISFPNYCHLTPRTPNSVKVNCSLWFGISTSADLKKLGIMEEIANSYFFKTSNILLQIGLGAVTDYQHLSLDCSYLNYLSRFNWFEPTTNHFGYRFQFNNLNRTFSQEKKNLVKAEQL